MHEHTPVDVTDASGNFLRTNCRECGATLEAAPVDAMELIGEPASDEPVLIDHPVLEEPMVLEPGETVTDATTDDLLVIDVPASDIAEA